MLQTPSGSVACGAGARSGRPIVGSLKQQLSGPSSDKKGGIGGATNLPGNSFVPRVQKRTHRRESVHYLQALKLAREQQFEAARKAFEGAATLRPDEVKVWVSWAQMEKRSEKLAAAEGTSEQRKRFMRSRAVLQQGLQLNPDSAKICQAWGLLELQAGNAWAALALLERSVRADPACSPVLRWHAVQTARLAVSARRQHCPRTKLSSKLETIS